MSEYCNHDQLEYDPEERLIARCLKCGTILVWNEESASFDEAPIDYTENKREP